MNAFNPNDKNTTLISPQLFIMNGPDKGKVVPVEKDEIFIGRVRNNDLQIKEKSISRRHILIEKKEGKFFVKDLNSTNGTFVNGKLIPPDISFEVKAGTPIVLGKILVSLGRPTTVDVFSMDDGDLSGEFSSTALFTAYKDRPMTTPKNLELIHKVSNVLIQSLDINEILEKFLDHLFELLKRIDRGVIILIEPETGNVTGIISRTAGHGEKNEILYSRSIVNKVIREKQPIIMLDTFGQDESQLSESMEIMKVRSVMSVPLISREQLRGVIYVDSINTPYGFREEDLALLTSLSSSAAIAIENALLYSNLEDIVEQRTRSLRETEKKLRESEARFKAIFDNMSSGVIVYRALGGGKDFEIIDMNESGQKIENLKKKDLLSRTLLEVFPASRNNGLFEMIEKVWNTGRPERGLITFSEDSQVTGWREYYIYRLPSNEVVSIFDDMTEKKRAEEDQANLQKQLLISQKMESIGAFAGGTAHNFRNILQAIQGNVEYMEAMHAESREIKETTRSIYNSIDKGVDLINNLLHFSKRGGDLDVMALDLSEVIREAYELINKVFNKNINIEVRTGKNLYVKGNHGLLSQAFMNLLTNARDAMPNGGELLIETKPEGKRVLAVVQDTGHGIDKSTQEKIFDPFFSLKDVGKGTGLGLSTTLGIIEQHNGKITVASEPARGTTFTISLPLADTESLPRQEKLKVISQGQGQKILIVDDEQPILDSLTALLKKIGYEALPVDKPVQVLDQYKNLSPDLVLIDRVMPEMDGITCIRQILDFDPDAKIIIISGFEKTGVNGIDSDIENRIKGYLTKPCGAEELSKIIEQALGGG